MIDDALRAVLTDHVGGPVTFASPPRPLTGGFWASIYTFELADAPEALRGPLVVRVMPDRVAGVRESVVQQTIAAQGFRTPQVLLAGVDDDLGGPFIVMPLVAGKPLLGGLALGRSLLRLPGVLRRIPEQLADAALDLHALDPAPLEAALQDAGVSAGVRGVANRLDEVAAAAQSGARGFAEVLSWLRDRMLGSPVATAEAVICHGDLHPFNLLEDEHGLVTVLDWTNARLMPREMEVGLTAALLRCAPLDAPRFVGPVIARLTDRLARRFVTAYARRVPVDQSAVDTFEALQYARCLAEVVSARRGETAIVGSDHPFEKAAPAMIRRLADLTSMTIALPERSPARI